MCSSSRLLSSRQVCPPCGLQGDFAAAINDECTIDAVAAVGNTACFHPVRFVLCLLCCALLRCPLWEAWQQLLLILLAALVLCIPFHSPSPFCA